MNQLTKTSSSEEIKMYFNAVLKLAKSNEKYPVDLDEVWVLVYKNRDDAVKSLKRDFVEGEDYEPIRQKSVPENQPFNPNPKIDYHLTVPCLEYFIVKKVRPVFEVYRQVFHKAPEMLKRISHPTPTKVKASIEWVRGVKDLLSLNDSSVLTMIKQVAEPLGLPTPDYTPSKGVLESAGNLLKENGLSISTQVFNHKMIEKGYMIELTRSSSKGTVKTFKSITGEGLNYGENQVHPNNPKSTQPLYYTDKFIQLLGVLGLKQVR